jgi:hypothetical protein
MSKRRTDDATLMAALRILARDIESEDGLANACIAEAADRLQELADERRWIPVGERLPEPATTVLMLIDGVHPVSGWYENGHFHNAYDATNVTHWQPLPGGPEAA